MLADQTIQANGGRPGATPVNDEITCSRCRHWNVKHVRLVELDEYGASIEEYFARCLNNKSLYEGLLMEADEGCEVFEPR